MDDGTARTTVRYATEDDFNRACRSLAEAWIKSTNSGSQANCEIMVRDRVLIRDTKDRTGRVLRFTPTAWREFAEQLKAGESRIR